MDASQRLAVSLMNGLGTLTVMSELLAKEAEARRDILNEGSAEFAREDGLAHAYNEMATIGHMTLAIKVGPIAHSSIIQRVQSEAKEVFKNYGSIDAAGEAIVRGEFGNGN